MGGCRETVFGRREDIKEIIWMSRFARQLVVFMQFENRGVELMRTTKTSVNKRKFSLHALTRPAFKPNQFQINVVNQTYLLGLSEVTHVLLVRGSGEIEYAERVIPDKK